MGRMFRYLHADEIDARVARVMKTTKKDGSVCTGVMILFYKDARVDQTILDETVGPMNWQRHHSRDNANCTVSIWDEGKKQWISKEDTGTESNTEKEKGLASDSFKRACFNWGIGRELYTAPEAKIWGEANVSVTKEGKCYDRFRVTELSVSDGEITHVVVANSSKGGREVFRWDKPKAGPEYCSEADLNVIDEMWSKYCHGDKRQYPHFTQWPKVTKEGYAIFQREIREKLEAKNGTANAGNNTQHTAGISKP